MIELHTDAVVIGSGFGGSVVASRLIDEGAAVVMLERGPWRNTIPVASMNVRQYAELPRKSFSQLLCKSVMSFYHHWWPRARGFGINRNSGTYEVYFHKGYTSVCSSQVGGGSMIYGGLIDRPLDPEFWNGVADGVSEDILAPHFERVTSELGTVTVDGDELAFPKHLFDEMQKDDTFDLTLNEGVKLAHKLTDDGESKSVDHGIERKESKLRESLSFGCLDGSKASTDAIYLGPALAKGLQLLAHCEVTSIVKQAAGGYCVYASHRLSKQTLHVYCQQLFLGAGAHNTVRLLLEAQRDQGLAPMPGLGKGIGNNGDDLAVLLNATESDSVEDRTGLVTAFNPAGGSNDNLHIVANLDIPTPNGFLLRRLLRPVLKGALVAGMGRDLANGVARLKKNRLTFDYDPRQQETNRTITEGNSATAKALKKLAITFRKPITAHPFGGARVSQDVEEGVVNGLGECHQNPGLFVIDGAAIPKSPGRAPSLNIAAWASHVAGNAIRCCDSHVSTRIKVDIDLLLKRSKTKELGMLFSSLPPAKAAQASSLDGSWGLKKLTAERRWFTGHFDQSFDEGLMLSISNASTEMIYLKPRLSTLNQPQLANAWDGSGLVYQITTTVKGESIAMQMRKLPEYEAWLVRSSCEQAFLGWHLLTR